MNEADLAERLQFAKQIAEQAGKQIMARFATNVRVERKSDDSPVTVADREAETFLRLEIEKAYPNDGIIGEEHGATSEETEFRWIVDPIDGTKSFISGVPLFSTLVAVQHHKQSVIGVIELPALDWRVYAAAGLGAWEQVASTPPIPAKVASGGQLRDGLYVTSEVGTFANRGAMDVHTQLESHAWFARTWGDGYGYYLVATGRALAMVDSEMSIWDAAALLPVISEAGGRFTDWAGQPTVESSEAIATNGHVHEQVLAITRPFADKKPA